MKCFLFFKEKKKKTKLAEDDRAQNLRVFGVRELRNATKDFSRLLKIGEGGSGDVYKGLIKPSGGKWQKIEVAIKKLNQNGLQGHKEWLTEILSLGVFEHPNLVKLIGYCAVDGKSGNQRFLVCEFMRNKSLEDHLFNKAHPVLPWSTRLQIVLGVAEGLRYLHEGLEVQVIYRDFKASNILLDEEFKPKLSDFGLGRQKPPNENVNVTHVYAGIWVYAPPEYVMTGLITIKGNVWSFGVLMFEILTGQHARAGWLEESRKSGITMDPRLETQNSQSSSGHLVANLAITCTSQNPHDRPTMTDVVGGLKHAIQVSEAAGPN